MFVYVCFAREIYEKLEVLNNKSGERNKTTIN